MKTPLIFISVMFTCELALGQPQPYLKEVLRNLTEIKSASYHTTKEAWVPGDTVAKHIYHYYVKEYTNPADTTIGAGFVELMMDDTTKATYCYDGKMKASIDWEEKQIQIDSFQNKRHLPFRLIQAPFLNYVTSIIRYALNTKDQIQIRMKDLGSSVYVEIVIEGSKQVEFFGKPFYLGNPWSHEEISRYELWIDTANDLPYRVRREMSHDIGVSTCENIKPNYRDVNDFLVLDYLPADFPINKARSLAARNTMTGKIAPAWKLINADKDTTELKALRGKVLLMEFTSVSCGPCRLAVPFLNTLVAEYAGSGELDLIAIEDSNRNSKVLENYQRRTQMNYPFLLSTEEVTKSYDIQMVPTFFLIDSQKVIRRVISGYREGTTDQQIRDAIKELL